MSHDIINVSKRLRIHDQYATANTFKDFNFSRKDDFTDFDKIRAQSESIILCGMRGLFIF